MIVDYTSKIIALYIIKHPVLHICYVLVNLTHNDTEQINNVWGTMKNTKIIIHCSIHEPVKKNLKALILWKVSWLLFCYINEVLL